MKEGAYEIAKKDIRRIFERKNQSQKKNPSIYLLLSQIKYGASKIVKNCA